MVSCPFQTQWQQVTSGCVAAHVSIQPRFNMYCRCMTVRSASSILKRSAGHWLGIPNIRLESTAVFWGKKLSFPSVHFQGQKRLWGVPIVTWVLLRMGVRIGYCRQGTDSVKRIPVLRGQPAVLTGVVEVRNFQILTLALLRVEATSLF